MSKSKFIIHKDTHPELPAYVWVPISENFLHPKTVGGFVSDKTRYAYVEMNPEYYEKINIETNDKTEENS